MHKADAMPTPIRYETRHQVKFSDLDPFAHMSTGKYATYFVDHRMISLARDIGWSLKNLDSLGFMTFVRRLEVDFIRPVYGEQEITITSKVREFEGTDCFIECTMADAAGKECARCLMVVAHVDKQTRRASDWPAQLQAPFFEDSDAAMSPA